MAGFTYRNAPTSVKLAASAFLLLAVFGLGVAILQIYVRTGLSVQGALVHYRGDEATMQYPKSFGEMVEITHAHAFTMTALALMLSAAIALTRVPEWLKSLVVCALFGGVALDLALPWAVRYGPPWSVDVFGLSGALLAGGLLAAVAVPLYEMWLSRETRI